MPTTITTKTSWFSRIGSSIKGVFIGIVLVIFAGILLFWNEGRAVKTYQSFKEGASKVVSVPNDPVDSANEGVLVHFTGDAKTPSVLIDTDFGVGGTLLKLKRVVEIYQWEENTASKTVDKLGGGQETTTTYSYSQAWSENLIDSTKFQEPDMHRNPTEKLFLSQEFFAQNVSIGSFLLPDEMLRSLGGYEPMTITSEMLSALPYDMQENLEILNNVLYYANDDPTSPQTGSIRILYESIAPQTVSVIAAQKGKSLTPYSTKNGRTIAMIQAGDVPAAQMFSGAIEGNKTMTWIARVIGLILMFFGFRMALGVLPILAGVVPPLGKLLGAGASLVSFLLTMLIGVVIIAIAWITARPLVGILLLVAVIGVFFLYFKFKKSK